MEPCTLVLSLAFFPPSVDVRVGGASLFSLAFTSQCTGRPAGTVMASSSTTWQPRTRITGLLVARLMSADELGVSTLSGRVSVAGLRTPCVPGSLAWMDTTLSSTSTRCDATLPPVGAVTLSVAGSGECSSLRAFTV